MSTLATPTHAHPEPGSREDPYRYGWRFVSGKGANGKEPIEQVPLTAENLLHPEEGDFTVERSLHERNRRYLANQFTTRIAADATALVLSDCRISWDISSLRPHGADIAVIFGVRRRREDYKTYHVGEDGPRPSLITEIVSPDPEARANDVEHKVREYHQARVPCYVIVDRPSEQGPSTLIGYRYTPKRFVKMKPDKKGRLWLEPLKLWIGLKTNQVTLYDGTSNEELLDLPEAAAALNAVETRVRELEEKLRRAGGKSNGSSSR